MEMVLVWTRLIVVFLAASLASSSGAELPTTSANQDLPDVLVASPATEPAGDGEPDRDDGGPEPPTDDDPEVPDDTTVRDEPSEPTTSPSDDPKDGSGVDTTDDREVEPVDSREEEDVDEDADRDDDDRSDRDDYGGDEGDDDEEQSDPDDDRDNGSLVLSRQGTVVTELSFAGRSAPVGPDSIADKPSCAVNCIISGIAYATETEAWLEVKTTTPVRYYLEVYSFGYWQSQENDLTWETTFVLHFDGLQPGTVYNAWLLVRDEYGNKQDASGSFKTAG